MLLDVILKVVYNHDILTKQNHKTKSETEKKQDKDKEMVLLEAAYPEDRLITFHCT